MAHFHHDHDHNHVRKEVGVDHVILAVVAGNVNGIMQHSLYDISDL